MGTLKAGKVANLSAHEKNPLEDLRVLADKESLRFVMKEGRIVASQVGNATPQALFARQVLTI